MIGTAWMAELECIRYRGNDPDLLRRLAELDLRQICDVQPPRHISPLIRNHVEFRVAGNVALATPQQLAAHFVGHLISMNNEWRQYKIKPIQSTAYFASLEISWYDDHFYVILFAADPASSGRWHVGHFPKDPFSHGVGNIISNWLSCFPGTLANIRWCTNSSWHDAKVGHSTRF